MSPLIQSQRSLLAPAWAGYPSELWRRAKARPSLDLRFADNKSLVDAATGQNLVTFTRASSGTYVDSQGVIRTATTNLLLRSEEFNDASWTKGSSVSVSANTVIAPNGTLTADTVTADSGFGVFQTITSVIGVNYSNSIYVKAGTATSIMFRDDTGAGRHIVFNPSTGVITSTSGTFVSFGSQAVGDGWYRYWLVYAADATSVRGIVRPNSAGSAQTFAVWGAQLEQSSTVGEYIPTTSTINSAPRFDHNPTTGESLGLLVEEQRTNSIRNNTMVGAVVGTPGTLPTNWGESLTGLSRQVVEVGTQNGINYIDFRFFGTTAGTQFISRWDGIAVPVANGQTWTLSAWISLISGTLPSGNVVLSANLYTSGSSYIGDTTLGQIKPLIGATLSRLSGTATINAATAALARPYIYFLAANGEAVDFTLRIGMPQFEQGAFATSVIPTTTSAVTRSADVASITGSNFGVSRTNLLLRSEEFNDASWNKLATTVSANVEPSPFGLSTADKLTEDASTATHVVQQAPTVISGATYTFSCYLKAAERTFALVARDSAIALGVNLITGQIVGTTGSPIQATSQSVGNGWWRVVLTFTTSSTTHNMNIYTSQDGVFANRSYAGTLGSGIYLWGAQLETGTTATAYIPTTTAAVTVVESSWYRQDEGTVFGDFTRTASTNTQQGRVFSFSDGTNTNLLEIYQTGGSNPAAQIIVTTSQAGWITSSFTVGTSTREVLGYQLNNTNASFNGSSETADTVCTMPNALTQARIGDRQDGIRTLNGTIRRLTYWPTRLPNETLQGITQ